MTIVKYVFVVFFLYTNCVLAAMDSRITLPGGGDVLPATSLSLSLNGLIPSTSYSVICYIDTTSPFVFVRLGSNFSDNTSSVVYYSLNGHVTTQAQLKIGHNIALMVGYFTSPATSYLTFSNLDQSGSFNVNSCFALAAEV